MSSEERALLEAFVVGNEDLERLEALLAEFNIFEALGVVRQELRHSDFLAFLMDPSQNHGLGDAFLKRLLKRVLVVASDPPLSAVDIDVADLRGAVVRREWHNIDILVHDPQNHLACAIENKVGSGEHSDQLRRYRQVVSREFPADRAVLVFLTPEGDPPSDEAYIPFSYTEVATLVDAVREAHRSTMGSDVYALMTHYTTMLRRHIVSDSEIAELCRKIYERHQRALDLIFEHRPDLQSDLADTLREMITMSAQSHGLELDESLKAYIRFAVTDWDRFPAQRTAQRWTSSKRILLFVFSNLASRLSLGLFIGPGPETIRQAVYETAQEHPRIFRGIRKQSGGWLMIYRKPFLDQRDYADPDLGELKSKLQAEWDKFLAQDLPALRRVIEEMRWPELPAVGA